MSFPFQQYRGGNPAAMGSTPILLVQQKVGTTANGSAPLVVTFDAPVANGNSVIACLSFDGALTSFAAGPEFSDGEMDLLTQASGATSTLLQAYLFYIHNVSGSPTKAQYTLDLAVRASLHISEWSGLANAAPQDTSTNTNAGSSALEVCPATLDPTSLRNLVIGIGAYVSATDTYSAGPTNSFTRLTLTGGASVRQECAYLVRSADHSAVTSVVTISVAEWAGCAAGFGGI